MSIYTLYIQIVRDDYMIVSAIGSNFYYSPSVQYEYFGTSVSESRIQDLMSMYGINQTGDSEYDMRALYDAMYSLASNELDALQAVYNRQQQVQESDETEAQDSASVPWADLMGQVGLPVTGVYETDHDAFDMQIFSMKMSAVGNPQQLASVAQLEAQASVVFVKSNPSADQSAPEGTSLPSTASVSGYEILAALNKMYIYAY